MKSFSEEADAPEQFLAQNTVAYNNEDNEDLHMGDRVYIHNLGVRQVGDLCPICAPNQLDHFLGEDGGCARANDFSNDAIVIKLY